MTALTVYPGSRIGPAPARDPYRFNPIRDVRRAGITILTRNDCEWFAWMPRSNTIVVHPFKHPLRARGALTLALAHRALGHWGNSHRQDVEARDLAAQWLIPDRDADWARTHVPVFGVDEVAARLRVWPSGVRIRLGTVCLCLSNVGVFRGDTCECVDTAA